MIINIGSIVIIIVYDADQDDHQEELINKLEEPCRGAAEAMLCHYAFPGEDDDEGGHHHHYIELMKIIIIHHNYNHHHPRLCHSIR